LNNWPIGHRIAEGNAEFDDSRARVCQFNEKVGGCIQIWIARSDKGNEARLPFSS
jgi:hypothetical protein